MNISEYSLLKTAYYNSGISNTEKTANVLHKTIGGGALGAVTGALAGRGVGDGSGGNYSGTGFLLGGAAGALGGRHYGKVVSNLGKARTEVGRKNKLLGESQHNLTVAQKKNRAYEDVMNQVNANVDKTSKRLQELQGKTQQLVQNSNAARQDATFWQNQAQQYQNQLAQASKQKSTIADLEKQVANYQQQLKQFSNNPPANLPKPIPQKIQPAPPASVKNVAQTKPLPKGATGWDAKGEPIFKRDPNGDWKMDEISYYLGLG